MNAATIAKSFPIMLADGINVPLVLLYGVLILVPLFAFQIAVEGVILRRVLRAPFKALIRPVFVANFWSLLAGIPTKIINAYVYSAILPNELSAYFARYPFSFAMGTFLYFTITVLVEGVYLLRWSKNNLAAQKSFPTWSGVIIANVATYAVLAPLYFLATRPMHDVKEFTASTQWARQPPVQIIYIDSHTGYLKTIRSDGSGVGTLVPTRVTNYFVTSNLNAVLFKDSRGVRQLCWPKTGDINPLNEKGESLLLSEPMFGPPDRWIGQDSLNEWRVWVESGLGNSIRIYRTNEHPSFRLAVNPGLLHIANFDFYLSNPNLISDGNECLFQTEDNIYLLDIQARRVGTLANGSDYILLTDKYKKIPDPISATTK